MARNKRTARGLAGPCERPARPRAAHLGQDAYGLGRVEAVFHQLADGRVERLARIIKPCDDTREGVPGARGARRAGERVSG